MPSRSVFSVSSRDTASHFGVLKALEKKLLRTLRLRIVLITALDITAEEVALNSDTRDATLDDVGHFDAAGFPGQLQAKLQNGPGWIKVGEGGLRAWYFLKKRDCNIANWLIVRTDNPTAIWSAGLWVRRDQRGHDMASQARAPAVHWSKESGYQEIIAWIERTNHSSLRASRKAGYRVVGKVIALHRFGVGLVRHGRRWSLGRWDASRPLVVSLEDLRRDFGPPVPLKTFQ